MARNAVKKLRTLRHPGVIKVLDTVEVCSMDRSKMDINLRAADGNLHLHCYREGDAFAMAYQAEEYERGDLEMGIIWSGSKVPATCDTPVSSDGFF